MRGEIEGKEQKKISVSASFKTGVIALVFMIIGFESASFIGKLLSGDMASESRKPVTADDYSGSVDDTASLSFQSPQTSESRKAASITRHGEVSKAYARRPASVEHRSFESFPFDPNTAGKEEFIRLGFSEKQAQSLLNYRAKGGRFHRKTDFAKSFVVSDSLFDRLEPFIEIPLVDINAADSAELDALPGIGPYYAAKIIEYRRSLGGFSYKEQLMDIWNFDETKYQGLQDLIEVGECEPYPLWRLPEDSLKLHPYIGKYAAHGIAIYRENTPPEEWSVSELVSAGVLSKENAAKLSGCRLE